jgi:hypothetical protein
LSIKVCNIANSLWNIYIYKGLFYILMPYNKASAATQQAFWVVRYFLESVSKLLYYYLVCICPFVQYLERRILGRQLVAEQPYYLWLARGLLKVERPSRLYKSIGD